MIKNPLIRQDPLGLWSLWAGEIPLAKAVWLYGFMVFTSIYGFVVSLPGTAPHTILSNTLDILLYALVGFEMLYAIIWSVGVWRSCGKYQGALIWRYLSYFLVVTEVFATISNLGSITYALTR